MKKVFLKGSDELLLKAYEVEELQDNIKEKIIAEHYSFLIGLDKENEKLTRTEVIDNIKANGYLYSKTGQLIPLTYHTRTKNHRTMITKIILNLFGTRKEVTLRRAKNEE